MKVLAFLLALTFVVQTFLANLFVWFLNTFTFENQTAQTTSDFWGLLLPASLALVFAFLVLGAVALSRWRLALGAYALHVASGALLFARGVGISDHSDGLLIVFALAIELTGLAGVVLLRPKRGGPAHTLPGHMLS